MIQMAEEVTDAAADFGAPGKWMVDIFPFRECAVIFRGSILASFVLTPLLVRYVPDWFPGAGWKQVVKEQHDNLRKLINTPYEWVQKEIDEGRAGPSFASELLSEKNLSEQDLFAIKWYVYQFRVNSAPNSSVQ